MSWYDASALTLTLICFFTCKSFQKKCRLQSYLVSELRVSLPGAPFFDFFCDTEWQSYPKAKEKLSQFSAHHCFTAAGHSMRSCSDQLLPIYNCFLTDADSSVSCRGPREDESAIEPHSNLGTPLCHRRDRCVGYTRRIDT